MQHQADAAGAFQIKLALSLIFHHLSPRSKALKPNIHCAARCVHLHRPFFPYECDIGSRTLSLFTVAISYKAASEDPRSIAHASWLHSWEWHSMCGLGKLPCRPARLSKSWRSVRAHVGLFGHASGPTGAGLGLKDFQTLLRRACPVVKEKIEASRKPWTTLQGFGFTGSGFRV